MIDKGRLKKKSRGLATYKLKFHNTDLVGERLRGKPFVKKPTIDMQRIKLMLKIKN